MTSWPPPKLAALRVVVVVFGVVAVVSLAMVGQLDGVTAASIVVGLCTWDVLARRRR